jgi:NTP pyrophosphatase (non-canonical NTP hydrolase)
MSLIQTFDPSLEHIFQDTIDRYGIDAQLDQMQEEAIELALAIRKYKRAQKHGTLNDVNIRTHELLKEIADVIIMTQQMRLGLSDMYIQSYIRQKLERQKERLANHSHES